MPEGPEVRRSADQIERAVANKPLTCVFEQSSRAKEFKKVVLNSVDTFERHSSLISQMTNQFMSIFNSTDVGKQGALATTSLLVALCDCDWRRRRTMRNSIRLQT